MDGRIGDGNESAWPDVTPREEREGVIVVQVEGHVDFLHVDVLCRILKKLFIMLLREKEGDLTLSPMTKTLIRTENLKTNGQHKNATKTSITQRLRLPWTQEVQLE